MPSVLLAGLYMPGSGLTGVLMRLAAHLSATNRITLLGFVPEDVHRDETLVIDGIRVHLLRGPQPRFSADPQWLAGEMTGTETESRPSMVVVHGPAFLVAPLLEQLQPYRQDCPIILYLPIEGQPVGGILPRRTALADLCLLYTQTAKEELMKLVHMHPPSPTEPARRPTTFEVLGHGVDMHAFRPLHESHNDHTLRRITRRKMFPHRPDLADAFLVLNANRPYFRKRLDLTIDGFAVFARTRPEAHLILHTGARSRADDMDLCARIASSGVSGQILLSPALPQGDSLCLERLNLLYNACDVGLSTAMGEGWGLTTFEHAATGAPQIVPDHTTFQENWAGASLLLPCMERQFIFYESAEMFITTPAAVAEALTALYEQPTLRARLALAAYERAADPRFRWEAFVKRFSLLTHSYQHPPTIPCQTHSS
ncbi:MAG: glycosyltransferase family 4 protein [Luteolibacter sp.]